MAALLGGHLSGKILEPAVGPGALLAACRRLQSGKLDVTAYEIDEKVLGSSNGDLEYMQSEITDLRIQNYLESPAMASFSAIIANPPYLRHHKISPEIKALCKDITFRTLGISIDARAGLHIYFLIKALEDLAENGRLVFLMPADTFEGVFAEKLWSAISKNYRIDGVITLSSEVAAFPGVDTNAVIVSITKSEPTKQMLWCKWRGKDPIIFADSISYSFQKRSSGNADDLECIEVDISNAIKRGFTRSQTEEETDGLPFSNFAKTMRGIATGENDFFVMTKKRLNELGLDESNFVRTIMRVKDLPKSGLNLGDLEDLDAMGRPTYLLSINQDSEINLELSKYLKYGEELGIHKRALVSARKNWYFMEKREPVPILFAYLGRRNVRFTLVETEIQPLTGFLCIYPLKGVDAEKLVQALNHPSTIKELSKVGKSYGDGAIKVEPGGLRKLVIPFEALKHAGIKTIN